MDVLIPIAASGVPYVGIDQVMQKLGTMKSGIRVTRDLVMDVLDPEKVKLVKSISGDRIEFVLPSPVENKHNEEDAEHDKHKVDDMAKKQLNKELKDKNN